MKALDRYIIGELLVPLGQGIAMFTALLLAAVVMPDIARLAIRGGSLFEVVQIFVLSLPTLIVVTGPMAMLQAALLGMGRISADSELVAALASGISLRRIVAPIVALGVAVAIGDFAFQEVVKPPCTEGINRLRDRILARTDVIKDRPLIFFDRSPAQGTPRMMVGARQLKLGPMRGSKVTDGTLLGVKIVYLSEEGVPLGLVYAREARFDPQVGQWRLQDMRYYIVPQAENAAGKPLPSPQHFDNVLVDLGKPPAEIGKEETDPEEMTVARLRRTIGNRIRHGFEATEYTRRCEVELNQRFSVPFAAVVFALMGAPLGVRRQRTSSSMGAGLSVLIIFVYYVLWTYLGTLGRGDALDPFLAAWIPNMAGIAAGVIFLQRAPK